MDVPFAIGEKRLLVGQQSGNRLIGGVIRFGEIGDTFKGKKVGRCRLAPGPLPHTVTPMGEQKMAMKVMGSLRSGIRFLGRHKLIVIIAILMVLPVTYGIGCAMVAMDRSPARDYVELDADRMMAYMVIRSPSDDNAVDYLLIHGTPAHAGCWRRVAAAIPDSNIGKWIAIDRLGFGNSTNVMVTSLEEHGQSIADFIDKANLKRPILIGHSYGGPVALAVAAYHPELIGGVVLVAGACDPYMKDSVGFRKWVHSLGILVPRPWRYANKELLDLTGENRKMEGQLSRVVCPVVAIHGTWDPVCPYNGTMQYLRGALSSAESFKVVALPRVGHNIHLTHPEIIIREAEQLAGDGAEGDFPKPVRLPE